MAETLTMTPHPVNEAAIHVFMSSTCADLKEDCRPGAVRAMRNAGVCVVEMASWCTDYLPPIDVCEKKIARESTHYLGLFAFRRGWAPEELKGKSITEAEFDWARARRPPCPVAVFTPDPRSAMYLDLKSRAAGQSADDEKAQTAFLSRVSREGVYILFEAVDDLTSKVSIQIMRWRGGGLRQVSARQSASAANPVLDSVLDLGRLPQATPFNSTLTRLFRPGTPRLACFLVHGPQGHGHDQMVERLLRSLGRTGYRHVMVRLIAQWREKTPASLLAAIAKDLGEPAAAANLESLAAALARLLTGVSVVLDVRQVQRFDGSLPGLVENFWRPLVRLLGKPTHRLIVLLTCERESLPQWNALLQDPGDGPAAFDPARPVRLPSLTPFSLEELIEWFYQWLPDAEGHEDRAQMILDETEGRPDAVYAQLANETRCVWALEEDRS